MPLPPAPQLFSYIFMPMATMQMSYRLTNRRGEALPLSAVWANTPVDPGGGSPEAVAGAARTHRAGLFTAGAGDCAAPKLLEAAARLGLRPVSLAEVWFGASLVKRVVTTKHSKLMARLGRRGPLPPVMTPVSVTRAQGRFYPCCDKCSRILGWQLCSQPQHS